MADRPAGPGRTGLGLPGLGLDVQADLRMSVTAPSGASTTAHITGNGRLVRVETARPDVLFASVDRADIGRVADLLDQAGVTVRVVGPGGPVATIGAGTSSRLGRAVTGSARVAPAAGAARFAVSPGVVRATALAGVLVVLAFLRRLRRS